MDKVLRLGIDPTGAVAGAKQYRAATQEAADAAASATAAEVTRQAVVNASARVETELAAVRIRVAQGTISEAQAVQVARAAQETYNATIVQTVLAQEQALQATQEGRVAYLEAVAALNTAGQAAEQAAGGGGGAYGFGRLDRALVSVSSRLAGTNPVLGQAALALSGMAGALQELALPLVALGASVAIAEHFAKAQDAVADSTKKAAEEAEKQTAIVLSGGQAQLVYEEEAKKVAKLTEELNKLATARAAEQAAARGAVGAGATGFEGYQSPFGLPDAGQMQKDLQVATAARIKAEYDAQAPIRAIHEQAARDEISLAQETARQKLEIAKQAALNAAQAQGAPTAGISIEFERQAAILTLTQKAENDYRNTVVELSKELGDGKIKQDQYTSAVQSAAAAAQKSVKDGTELANALAHVHEQNVQIANDARGRQAEQQYDRQQAAVTEKRLQASNDLVDTYKREYEQAERLATARQLGKAAEEVEIQQIARENAERTARAAALRNDVVLSEETIKQIGDLAAGTVAYTQSVNDTAEAERKRAEQLKALAQIIRQQAQEQERATVALDKYLAKQAQSLIGSVLGNSPQNQAIGGMISGAISGFEAAGPWGAVAGAAVSGITSIINLGKAAEQAALQLQKIRDQATETLEGQLAQAKATTPEAQAMESFRNQFNAMSKQFATAYGLSSYNELHADTGHMSGTTLDSWKDWMSTFAQRQQLSGKALQEWNEILAVSIDQINAIKAAEAERSKQFDNDLEVRRLVAAGDNDAADALRRQIEEEQQLADARKNGMSDAQIATLAAVQADEDLATARDKAAAAAQKEADRLASIGDILHQTSMTVWSLSGNDKLAGEQDIMYKYQQIFDKLAALGADQATVQRAHDAEQLELQKFDADYARQQNEAQAQILDKQLQVQQQALAKQEQTVNTLQQVYQSLQQFSQSLLVGSQSPLSPHDQLVEAQNQFHSLAALALGGDVSAAQGLQASAQQLLTSGRGYYASGAGYQDIFKDVQAQVAAVRDRFGQQASVEQEQLNEMQRQTNLLQQQIDILRGIDGSSQAAADAAGAAANAAGAAAAGAGKSDSPSIWQDQMLAVSIDIGGKLGQTNAKLDIISNTLGDVFNELDSIRIATQAAAVR